MSTTPTTEAVTLTGNAEGNGPTLEESYADLKAKGIISDDTEGASTNAETTEVAPEGDADQGSTEDRPDWLPEKFKTVEDMAAAYAELEKKQSGDTDEDTEETTETLERNPNVTEEEFTAAENAVEKAGLNLEAVSKEFFDNDGLTDDTYASLATAGFPKDMVDTYIQGLTSRSGDVVEAVYATVGGNEQYDEMITWAADNLSPTAQAAYDKAVQSGDREAATLAVRGLKAQWSEATADTTVEPDETVEAKGSVASSGYEHMDDYLADLADPQYTKSQSFRDNVQRKLGRSGAL